MRTQRQQTLALGVLVPAALALSAEAASAQPKQVWEASGFEQPESAVLDAERNVLYVSNVAGSPIEKDGKGYISKLSPDGNVAEAQWVTGLDAPKGMDLHGDRLYVADIDRLVVIDVNKGQVVETYPAEGAQFLNDVTADSSGRIYVSDMMDNAIYVLDGDTFKQWLQDKALESPNGLLAEDDRLVVAGWGVMVGGPQPAVIRPPVTEMPGHLKVVDYATQKVSSLGNGEPVGNLDGVERDGNGGYLVTDWMNGALFRIDAQGKAEQLLDLNQGSADHEYLEEQSLVVIPMMNDGVVRAYRVD
jgi:DNA-binding beta-propeller fold protein YncE